LLGLCDALEARLKAAQVERERLAEAVVQQIAFGTADNRTGGLPGARYRGADSAAGAVVVSAIETVCDQ